MAEQSDKKKLLIIGTSHTVGSCDSHQLPVTQRWFANLYEHYDVDVFARSGVTAQHQVYAFMRYLLDYPDKHWDSIIIEGRQLGTLDISYPEPTGNLSLLGSQDNPAFYDMFIKPKSQWKGTFLLPFTNISKNTMVPNKEWYEAYVHSDLHFTDNYSANLALCEMAAKRCDKILWWSYSNSKNIEKYWMDWAYTLLKDYTDEDIWPTPGAHGFVIEEHEQCGCGHYNLMGNLKLQKFLKPILIKRGIL